MATDIVDKDLKNLRNARWDKAFKGEEEDEDKDVNRKATIVIERESYNSIQETRRIGVAAISDLSL